MTSPETSPSRKLSGDLSVDKKLRQAEARAREFEAEKHFFDAAQPFFPLGFSINYRNPGHWDVYARRCPGFASAWQAAHPDGSTSDQDDARERAFRIRGRPDAVIIYDERWDPHRPHPRGTMCFRNVLSAVLWVAAELMQEPVGDGQEVPA